MKTYTNEQLFAAMQKYRIYPQPFALEGWAINFFEGDLTEAQEAALNTPGWIPEGLFPTPEAAVAAALQVIESAGKNVNKASPAALANHALSAL